MIKVWEYSLLVFVISFFLLSLSVWTGANILRKLWKPDDSVHEDFGIILGATLTLLGLIIGFSFSMAISRYDQRKNYEETEANAIGTEYVRAELLPAADAAKVRALLKTTSISVSCSTPHGTGSRSFRSMPARRNCRPSCGPLSSVRRQRSRLRWSRWPFRA